MTSHSIRGRFALFNKRGRMRLFRVLFLLGLAFAGGAAWSVFNGGGGLLEGGLAGLGERALSAASDAGTRLGIPGLPQQSQGPRAKLIFLDPAAEAAAKDVKVVRGAR